MSEPAVRVESLGKRYRLGPRGTGYRTLREDLATLVRRAAPAARDRSAASEIWALRDLSFEIGQGTALAVIGRNGAGKSTLLKILTRITPPTTGRVELRGRVGSLLEVGTGFHPELTGRENIFLNGAILGMKRAEIRSKFDTIVQFAEVERFLDTPVKRYSSGMYVRLAFAVAAHLEPSILLVDEVLAVGDARFQQKCLGKMGEVSREGRTVLFVSHNMIAVKKLCNMALLLEEGEGAAFGGVLEVVKAYQHDDTSWSAERSWPDPARAPGDGRARLAAARIRGADGSVTADIDSRDGFDIEVDYLNLREGARLGVTAMIFGPDGECILGSISNSDAGWHDRPRPEGLFRSVCRVPGDFFPDGRFSISLMIWGDGYSWSFREDEVLGFTVHETEGSARGDYTGGMDGVVRPRFEWSTARIDGSH